MPIDRTGMEGIYRDPSAMIVDFLRINYRFAFTRDELIEELAALGTTLAKDQAARLLISLEYGGGIESEVKGGVTYYRYRKVFGFAPLKRSR